VGALKDILLPQALLVTPNLYEAGGLLDGPVDDLGGMKDAARALHALGPRAVLVKGGHLPGGDAVDVFFDGEDLLEITGPRFDTDDTHGTGCALAAAITARVAHGDPLGQAIRVAKDFVAGAIRHGLRLGGGHGPVNPGWQLKGAAGWPG
jgi:hydroxymethylpyrimidine/phosphomethylpyrimidine kinase